MREQPVWLCDFVRERLFDLQLSVKRLGGTAQVHRGHKLLHGCQLSICQKAVLGSDPIDDQSKLLLLQTENDLRATHSPSTEDVALLLKGIEWYRVCESTHRVPLPIVVLLPVEDLILFAHRQSDPALGYVQNQMRAPSSGRRKEQEAFRSSGPDIQGEVGPGRD